MTVKAPKHLKTDTKHWFDQVMTDFELEQHHIRLLVLCCESWDRCEEARKAIKQHGLVFKDRFEQPHARPEIAIERDNRLAFARLLRELDLDVSPPDDSRPPSLKSNRR